MDYKTNEVNLSNFKGKEGRSPITDKIEIFFSWKQRSFRIVFGLVCFLATFSVVIATVLAVESFKIYLYEKYLNDPWM